VVTVTEKAVNELKDMLQTQGTPEDRGVKLVEAPSGGLAMTIAPPVEGDEVVRHEDRPLLIVDRVLAARLDGTVLDVKAEESDASGSARFVLTSA